jgi:hypothetical protein
MTPLRTAWEALNEDCPTYLLISAWCFFIVGVILELILPTLFGMLTTYPVMVPMNERFELTAMLLNLLDKLLILLLLFCGISTYIKFHFAVDEVKKEEKEEVQ